MNHKQRKRKRKGKRVKEPYFAANGTPHKKGNQKEVKK